jgi:hypothetical protein
MVLNLFSAFGATVKLKLKMENGDTYKTKKGNRDHFKPIQEQPSELFNEQFSSTKHAVAQSGVCSVPASRAYSTFKTIFQCLTKI